MHVIEFFTAEWGEYCKQAEADIVKGIIESGKKDVKFIEYDIDKETFYELLEKKFNEFTKVETEGDPVIPFTIIDEKHIIMGYPEDMKERIIELLK